MSLLFAFVLLFLFILDPVVYIFFQQASFNQKLMKTSTRPRLYGEKLSRARGSPSHPSQL